MKPLLIFYIFNATLLMLHEIESAYEKEWEILKLPGKLTGFLLMHIPIIFFLFYGLLEIEKRSKLGLILGVVAGIAGLLPLVVHKILVRRREQFNSQISNGIIYLNIITGIFTLILSLRLIIYPRIPRGPVYRTGRLPRG